MRNRGGSHAAPTVLSRSPPGCFLWLQELYKLTTYLSYDIPGYFLFPYFSFHFRSLLPFKRIVVLGAQNTKAYLHIVRHAAHKLFSPLLFFFF